MEQLGRVRIAEASVFFTQIKFKMMLAVLVLGSYCSQAQTDLLMKSVRANVQGTSSLHDWESEITKIDYKGSLKTVGNTIKSIKDVEVKILVEGIKSKEGKVMDHKTFEAFKSDKNPFIIYAIKTARVKTGADNNVTIEASGNLTMAGTTKAVAIIAKGKILENGDLEISVSKKLKMTDFNIVPPSAVLGTIHVGDEVTVNFDIVLTHPNNIAK